jgi:hypothetical protein
MAWASGWGRAQQSRLPNVSGVDGRSIACSVRGLTSSAGLLSDEDSRGTLASTSNELDQGYISASGTSILHEFGLLPTCHCNADGYYSGSGMKTPGGVLAPI